MEIAFRVLRLCTTVSTGNLVNSFQKPRQRLTYPRKRCDKVFYHNTRILPLPSSHSFRLWQWGQLLQTCSGPHPHRISDPGPGGWRSPLGPQHSATCSWPRRHRWQGGPLAQKQRDCPGALDTAGHPCLPRSHQSSTLSPAESFWKTQKAKKEAQVSKDQKRDGGWGWGGCRSCWELVPGEKSRWKPPTWFF